MATHSSTLAWKILRTEEPGRLQSMGSRRIRHDWVTSLWLFTFMHWRRKWQPIQCSCLENPRDGEAWWAAVYGVAQSRTWLKRLSSSSSRQLGLHVFEKIIPLYLRGTPTLIVKLDCLVKVVLDRFLQCQLLTFSLSLLYSLEARGWV